MRLNYLFKRIESVRFAINFSVISGFKIFQIALEENKTLRFLVDDLKQHPDHKERVVERLVAMLQADNLPEYQHPNDIAIAAYLFVLEKVEPSLAHGLAQKLSTYRNLWWARRIAEYIVESRGTAAIELKAPLPANTLMVDWFFDFQSTGVGTQVSFVNWGQSTIMLNGAATYSSTSESGELPQFEARIA